MEQVTAPTKTITSDTKSRMTIGVSCQIAKPHYPKTDANGYTEMQLWDFMRLYGEHMDMGMEKVIEPLDLIYETKGVET